MKKFIFILIVVFIFMLPTKIYANSGELYCDFASDTDIKLNKGFNIYLNLKCDNKVKLSALRIDIEFDNSKLKFLSAEAGENSAARINTSLVNDSTVRLLYINEAGQSISDQLSEICSIRFKPTVAPDNFTYIFSARILEAGTSEAEYLSVMNSPSFSISTDGTLSTINTEHNESSVNNSSDKSGRTKNSSNGSSSRKISSDNNDESESSDASENESDSDISIGERKKLDYENGFSYFLYGIFGTLLLGGIAFAAYRLGKKSK